MRDEKPKDVTDSVRWVDTDVMLADPLTKVMDPCMLVQALESNKRNLEQPINAVIVKKAKRLQRRKTETKGLLEEYKSLLYKGGETYLGDDLDKLVVVTMNASRMHALETDERPEVKMLAEDRRVHKVE